jgi:hypothetical protein
MCVPKMSFVQGQLQAEQTPRTRLYGDWLLLYGASSLMVSAGLNAIEANFGVQATWRTADVRTDMPNGWQSPYPTTAGGAWATNDSVNPHTFDVSTASTTAMFVQAAAITVLTTGTTLKEGFVKLWSAVNTRGFIVARQRVEIMPGLGTDTAIVPVGNPFCCVGLNGLMFGFVFSGVSGTITPTPCWRPFDSGDVQKPGSWSAFSSLTNVTSNKVVNSGHNAISTTDKMLAQAGFQFSTSGTNPKAVVDIIVAAKEG